MASRKVTVIDLLNEYLAKGQKPPPQLLKMAAEQEALKKPPAALDPVQIASGAYAFGPLAEAANVASGPVLDRLPLSELLGPVGKVPQLIQMAQKGVSGQTRPLSGAMGETGMLPGGGGWNNPEDPSEGVVHALEDPFAGLQTPTQPLLPKGVQMPGGTVQAKGTKMMLGAPHFPGQKTDEFGFDDAMDAAIDASEPGLQDVVGDKAVFNQLMNIFSEPKKAHGATTVLGGEGLAGMAKNQQEFNELLDMMAAPKQGTTGPLPPQGAVTQHFGNFGQAKPNQDLEPFAPKTEKLTPFEAWKNLVSDEAEMSQKATGGLPGSANEIGQKQNETRQLPPSEGQRTASLEPDDITEMAGHETPRTEDLVEALKQNLKPGDTTLLPENTLYHGLNVFHNRRAPQLAGIASEGMKGGWFSEDPHQPFGPHFIGARPEDLPPLLIRSKQFNVDPEKEIIPRWKKMNTENLFTKMQMKGKSPSLELTPDIVKGRPALRSNWPNIHQLVGADEEGGGTPLKSGGHIVPPEKLFLTNETGETVGRMAPKSGENAVNKIFGRAKALRNVLEKGTSSIDNLFQQMWGGDPELQNLTKAQKVMKLKQFLASAPKSAALQEIWQKFAGPVKAALKNSKLPDWIIENKASEDDIMDALMKAGEDIPK